MRLSELIDHLTEVQSHFTEDADPEVHIATNQNYPIAWHITAITNSTDTDVCPGCGEEADHDDDECPGADPRVNQHRWLWLATEQDYDQPYAPRWAWDGQVVS